LIEVNGNSGFPPSVGRSAQAALEVAAASGHLALTMRGTNAGPIAPHDAVQARARGRCDNRCHHRYFRLIVLRCIVHGQTPAGGTLNEELNAPGDFLLLHAAEPCC
jgi:hypothetical protein